MSMVSVYFDDSGTHQQSAVAVAACFVSDHRRWGLFSADWNSVLTKEGIRETGFHMADFVARQPPFDWDDTRRDLALKRLIGIIRDHALVGMTTAVSKRDYDQLITGRLREKLGNNHYTFAVQSCMSHINEWRHTLHDSQPYSYVFDQMGKGKNEINRFFEDMVGNNLTIHFGIEESGWSFQDRRQELPLQAADMLAWESYKYIRDQQPENARRSFQSILHGVQVYTRLFDGESLASFAEDVSRKYEAAGWAGPLGGFFPDRTRPTCPIS